MSTNKNSIGLFSSVSFAVGAMIGGGVFVLSGLAIKQSGPAAIVAFIIAGIMVLFSALSFSVLASNKSSSKYSGYGLVGKELNSPMWSFLTSWSFYLTGIVGAAFVLGAFGIYITQFLFTHESAILWAIIAGVILTLINFGPASEIGKIEGLLVSAKLIILILLIVFGIYHFDPHYFKPFVPGGFGKILISSAFLFIAFLGFNVITNISSHIKNPTKTIPRAIILSMVIVTIVYVGVVIALVTAHLKTYSEASVGVAAKELIGPIGGVLIVIGALISTLSSANANILGSSEVMVRMALDKQVPTIFAKLKHGHPYISVIAGGIIYLILILSNKTGTIIGLANVTAICALIIVNMAAFQILRKEDLYKGIKLPFKTLLPVLGIMSSIAQFFFMPVFSLILGFGLVAIGLIFYKLRKRFHIPKLHQELVKIFEESKSPLIRAFRL